MIEIFIEKQRLVKWFFHSLSLGYSEGTPWHFTSYYCVLLSLEYQKHTPLVKWKITPNKKERMTTRIKTIYWGQGIN